jgi:hypothetical protein
MSIETFIFLHNQDILLDFLDIKKFENLGKVTYVFLGDGDTSKINNLQNIIICKNLPINIEEYPKLTSFTGWYSIWKNKLYDSDYINLFEYDINLIGNFEETILKNIDVDIIGYIPLNVHHYNFIKHKPWSLDLLNSIDKNYQIKIESTIQSLPSDKFCSVTSNHTIKKECFESYMEWVEPMIDDIKHSKLSGHQIERSISLFYLLKNKQYKILPNILEHFQFDSHETQEINKNKFKLNYKKLLEKNVI